MRAVVETAGNVQGVTGGLRRRRTKKKGGYNMGDSTGSMFYAFGVFLLIYIVGASIYQGYLWVKKRRNYRKNDEKK